MSRRNSGSKNRRETLLRSLEQSGDGGFTTAGVKRMADPLGGRPAECTITGYCRTLVFEFPGFLSGRGRPHRSSGHLLVQRPQGVNRVRPSGLFRAGTGRVATLLH